MSSGLSRERLAIHNCLNEVESNSCFTLQSTKQIYSDRFKEDIIIPSTSKETVLSAWSLIYDLLCIDVQYRDLRTPDAVISHLLKLFTNVGSREYNGARNGCPTSRFKDAGGHIDFSAMIDVETGLINDTAWPGVHSGGTHRDILLSSAASVVVEKRSWSSMGQTAALLAAHTARQDGTNPTKASIDADKLCPTSVKGLHLPEWYIKFQ